MSRTRWVATASPDGKAWHARPELYQATTLVRQFTCKHRHTTEKAAIACARRLVGIDEDRLTI